MSYQAEINTLIMRIILDECKDKPEVQHFLEKAIEREMVSLNRSRNKMVISQDYMAILQRCMEEEK